VRTNIRCWVLVVGCLVLASRSARHEPANPVKNPNATPTGGGPALRGQVRGDGVPVSQSFAHVEDRASRLVASAAPATESERNKGAGYTRRARDIVSGHRSARARRNGLLHSRIVASVSNCAATCDDARHPSRSTQRSVIARAVGDTSPPQDVVLSTSSQLGNNYREVTPAAGSGNGIPPPPHAFERPGAPVFRQDVARRKPKTSPGGQTRQQQHLVNDQLTHPYKTI
jgi:hypothetical protein